MLWTLSVTMCVTYSVECPEHTRTKQTQTRTYIAQKHGASFCVENAQLKSIYMLCSCWFSTLRWLLRCLSNHFQLSLIRCQHTRFCQKSTQHTSNSNNSKIRQGEKESRTMQNERRKKNYARRHQPLAIFFHNCQKIVRSHFEREWAWARRLDSIFK